MMLRDSTTGHLGSQSQDGFLTKTLLSLYPFVSSNKQKEAAGNRAECMQQDHII